jgi:hypothetical protein
MRILVTIPHFFNPEGDGGYGSLSKDPKPRVIGLTNCLSALYHLYGRAQYASHFDPFSLYYANQCQTNALDIIICTTKDLHILDSLSIPAQFYQHRATNVEPMLLGFECQSVLAEHINSYDYYCFLEDDLILQDPSFFVKLNWFTQLSGNDKLLQPNRYELTIADSLRKIYIDGGIDPKYIEKFHPPREQGDLHGEVMRQPLSFSKATNPHSGCYFVNNEQMAFWMRQPHFLDRDTSFVGPLESAATLGVLRAFKIYKPTRQNASFLEIQHVGNVMSQRLLRALEIDTL